jgi:D-tyrosyl-tRNA(Tyr) deacylase
MTEAPDYIWSHWILVMRLILQRTAGVEVWIDGRRHSETGRGLLILFGTRKGDNERSCGVLADKTVNLRIFEDDAGKMNLSALDVGGEIMVVSQFMEPREAERLYDMFVERVAAAGLVTRSGVFGARMEIRFTNDGPVTILLEHDSE